MIDTPIMSPHGEVIAVLQINTEFWIMTKAETDKQPRYFYACPWTNFEKDLAEEITYEQFLAIASRIDEATWKQRNETWEDM